MQLPLTCPELCGQWCDACPGDRTRMVEENEDGDIFLPGGGGGNVTTRDEHELAAEDMVEATGHNFRTFKPIYPSLHPRQTNEDILEVNITDPKTWGAGAADWWNKMNGLIDDTGLRMDLTTRSTAQVAYLDMDEFDQATRRVGDRRSAGSPGDNQNGDVPIAKQGGGVPALRGSTLFVAASNLGIYMAHFWESPNFVAVRSNSDGEAVDFDMGRLSRAFEYNVANFTKYGHQDWFDASTVHESYPLVRNSPALEDLIKPRMILNETAAQWREFRLFQPRDPLNGRNGTVEKNRDIMLTLQIHLAQMLGVLTTEIARHDPFYEPNVAVPNGLYKPTPWHNTFTWQYGEPREHDHKFSDIEGMRVDEVRAFRATFNGERIAEMDRVWRHKQLPSVEQCRMRITIFATPHDELMDIRTRLYHPGEFLVYDTTKAYNPLPRDKDNDAMFALSTVLSGLKEDVAFWYSHKTTRDDEQPLYGDWEMFAFSGNITDLAQSWDCPTCRNGSWMRQNPFAAWVC